MQIYKKKEKKNRRIIAKCKLASRMWRGIKEKKKKKSTFYYLFISRPASRAGRSGDKQTRPGRMCYGRPDNHAKTTLLNGRDKG